MALYSERIKVSVTLSCQTMELNFIPLVNQASIVQIKLKHVTERHFTV